MIDLPPGATKHCAGEYCRLFSRLNLLAIAARNSGIPSTLVYLVSPRRIAAIAACLMLSGVSKSGSPAASPMTFRPPAFSSRDFFVIASVGDGLIRPSALAKNPGGKVVITRLRYVNADLTTAATQCNG